jgi:hypothetical protein
MHRKEFENNLAQIKRAFGFVFESLREIQKLVIMLKSDGYDEKQLQAAVTGAGFGGLDIGKLIAAKSDEEFCDLLMSWVQILVARYDSSASAFIVDPKEPC